MRDRSIIVGLAAMLTALVGFIIGVGQWSGHVMDELHVDAQRVAETQWRDVELASEALERCDQNNEIAVQVVLNQNLGEAESLLARSAENSRRISALLASLQTRVGSQEEQERLNAVVEDRKDYLVSAELVTRLVLKDQKTKAQKLLTRDTLPKLLRYHEAVRDFYDFQTSEMNEELKKNTAEYLAARSKVIASMASSAFLAVCIAGLVVFKLAAEIRSRTQAEGRIKKLNSELESKVNARTLQLESIIEELQAEIRERERAEEQVEFLAYYDPLTALPNRSLLRDRMTMALASARRHGSGLAVLFLDLDNFKEINDSMGHAAGDLLLKEVAIRLKANVREQDTVARLGGDEFVVMLTAVGSRADVALTAARLISDVGRPFTSEGYEFGVTCSIGMSVFPDDASCGDDLLKNADAAMYSAKQDGRNNFKFFMADMNADARRKLTLQTGLRHALERNELFLMFQPQVDLASGAIVGAEALLRWQHPELGLVPPVEFIAMAESVGLIVPIGEWVLRNACVQAALWQRELERAIPVSVNVSPLQFRQKGFAQFVNKVLNQTGLAAQYLELELTEGLILSTADVVMAVLKELKEMGVRLSIDDFGTGYSNLGYLRQFPVYKLKIDRMFVKDILANPDDAAITETIINMARSLKLRVLAEGVENEQQLSFLRAHNCDEFQGFYFSKPLSGQDFVSRLRRDAPCSEPALSYR